MCVCMYVCMCVCVCVCVCVYVCVCLYLTKVIVSIPMTISHFLSNSHPKILFFSTLSLSLSHTNSQEIFQKFEAKPEFHEMPFTETHPYVGKVRRRHEIFLSTYLRWIFDF